MNRLVTLFIFILIMSACGSADNFIDDLEDIETFDSIFVIPPYTNDSTKNNPSDTIIVGNDTIIPKDSTNQDVNPADTLICSYSKYMNISPTYGTGQGGACYDKYYFQGYQNNAAIGIYDLEKKTSLGKIDIKDPTPSSKIHANTLNFGSQRYDENDFFPLLYVSSGYTQIVNGNILSFIYVYRITKENNTKGDEMFGISLVQTISLKGFDHWTEGILDNDNFRLWIKYAANGASGPDRYASFIMPPKDMHNVEILQKDYLVDFSIDSQPFTSSNQGHLYYKDRILLVSGTTPATQKLAFIVINTITRTREYVIDLAEIGLRDEPENVFFYRDQLMIGYRNSIYKFNIKNIHDN